MHVAILSPVGGHTPPLHRRSREVVVSLLAEGLVDRGVGVTRLATGDSRIFEGGGEFDLIHSHLDCPPLTYLGMTTTPFLTTLHGVPSEEALRVYRMLDGRAYYVAVSEAGRQPELSYLATVHHGIALERFTFRSEAGGSLLFFGRIRRETGAREAIEIARRSGHRLLVAGLVQDEAYFTREVAPYLDGDRVAYVGCPGPEERNRLLGEALALLHPIAFEEPFSLAVVEAMACGTPVVAFNRGSMPELIGQGETGFLLSTVEEAAEAVGRIHEIERTDCRRRVESRFTAQRMVEDYLGIYEKILQDRRREDHRPWGYYAVLSDQPDHKVKRIVVYPGQRLSLQRHRHRGEHWYLVQGEAVVTRDASEIPLAAGEAVDIPREAWHRIRNPGEENLVFIEVQTGDSFGEDDIERKEDDYGRA